MKIKAVCEKTGLTDRAVRFYAEKGLIHPECRGNSERNFYEYTEQDVEELNEIAALRKAGFSIEEIMNMQENPWSVMEILHAHREKIQNEKDAMEEILQWLDCLTKDQEASYSDIHELAGKLIHLEKNANPPEAFSKTAYCPEEWKPDFGRLDTETREEKEQAYREFLGHQYVRDKKEARLGKLYSFLPIRIIHLAMRWLDKYLIKLLAVFALIFFVTLMYVMIPRKISSVIQEREENGSFLNVSCIYYDENANQIKQNTYYFRTEDEEYGNLLELFEKYDYHGFVMSLFARKCQLSGINQTILVHAGERYDGFVLCRDGRFYIERNGKWYAGYLDWYGNENAESLYDGIMKIIE